MTYIRMFAVLVLAGCTHYQDYTPPPAADRSLCEGVVGFCDPVEQLHTARAKEYRDAIEAGKKPPATDPTLDLGYSDAERGMTGRIENDKTIGR